MLPEKTTDSHVQTYLESALARSTERNRKMSKLLYAYCYRSGHIELGESLPEGTLPLGQSADHEKLRKIIDVNASHSKADNSPFVPRLTEAMSEDDAQESWKYFRRIVEMRLNDEKGWPPAPNYSAEILS